MAHYTYERLSSAAAALLREETSRRYSHSGTILVFESGPLGHPDGGVDFEAIRSAIESRLHLVPGYRRKLRWIPIEKHPVWVDDHEFNIAYHVRHTSLARPGGRVQLRTTAARLQAQRLDRSRPLWEYWVVEGLEGGRFALLAKTHNALLEGAGADLLQLLLSPDPEAEDPEPPPYRARPIPSTAELLWQETVRQARLPRRAVERWRGLASDIDELPRVLRHRADRFARMLGYSLPGVRETPLNGPIGPHLSCSPSTTPGASGGRWVERCSTWSSPPRPAPSAATWRATT
jgi:WS/DGAT/MGAT family acyltransferase